MINKNIIKHLQDISTPTKQVCLMQVPTLAIARRHDFQISLEFWYMKSLESVFRVYSILQVSWGRFTAWGKSDCNDFRIKYTKAAPKVCQTFEFNLNQPHPLQGPSPFPHISPMTPPGAWSRRYDDNSTTNQTRNWCHLDKSSTSAAAAVKVQQPIKFPKWWGKCKPVGPLNFQQQCTTTTQGLY